MSASASSGSKSGAASGSAPVADYDNTAPWVWTAETGRAATAPLADKLHGGTNVVAWPLYGPNSAQFVVAFQEHSRESEDTSKYGLVSILDLRTSTARRLRGGRYFCTAARHVQPMWVSARGRWLCRRIVPLRAPDDNEWRSQRAFRESEMCAASEPSRLHYVEMYDRLSDLVQGVAPRFSVPFPVLTTGEYPQYLATLGDDDEWVVALSDAPSMQDGQTQAWFLATSDRARAPGLPYQFETRTAEVGGPARARGWRNGEPEFVYGVGVDVTSPLPQSSSFVVWNGVVYVAEEVTETTLRLGARDRIRLPSTVPANERVPRWRFEYTQEAIWFVAGDELYSQQRGRRGRVDVDEGEEEEEEAQRFPLTLLENNVQTRRRVRSIQTFMHPDGTLAKYVTLNEIHDRSLPWHNAKGARPNILNADLPPPPADEDLLGVCLHETENGEEGVYEQWYTTRARTVAGALAYSYLAYPIHQLWAHRTGLVVSTGDRIHLVPWSRALATADGLPVADDGARVGGDDDNVAQPLSPAIPVEVRPVPPPVPIRRARIPAGEVSGAAAAAAEEEAEAVVAPDREDGSGPISAGAGSEEDDASSVSPAAAVAPTTRPAAAAARPQRSGVPPPPTRRNVEAFMQQLRQTRLPGAAAIAESRAQKASVVQNETEGPIEPSGSAPPADDGSMSGGVGIASAGGASPVVASPQSPTLGTFGQYFGQDDAGYDPFAAGGDDASLGWRGTTWPDENSPGPGRLD